MSVNVQVSTMVCLFFTKCLALLVIFGPNSNPSKQYTVSAHGSVVLIKHPEPFKPVEVFNFWERHLSTVNLKCAISFLTHEE